MQESNNPQSEASVQWYRDHREELVAYAIKHFRLSADCADDIVQAVYLRMQNTQTDIQNRRVYAFRVTHNLCIDLKRKEKSKAAIDDHVSQHGQLTDDICPERTTSARQLLAKLNSVIWRMPERRRKLFTMHRFQELSFAEIGRRTGLSESAVRKHVAKALAECQNALGNDHV
ncbi:MAG TPA: RNA polymerase sigma factor [Marinagarivorans sp.]